MLIELTDATSHDKTIINTEAIEQIKETNYGAVRIQLRSGMTLEVFEDYDEIKRLLKMPTEI